MRPPKMMPTPSSAGPDPRAPASEKMIQAFVLSALLRLDAPILVAGDMGGARRSRSEQLWAKATGLTAGEPDLRIYGPGGRTLFVELKAARGTLSAAQKARHAALAGLGHQVRVIRAGTGAEAAAAVTCAVREWLAG